MGEVDKTLSSRALLISTSFCLHTEGTEQQWVIQAGQSTEARSSLPATDFKLVLIKIDDAHCPSVYPGS